MGYQKADEDIQYKYKKALRWMQGKNANPRAVEIKFGFAPKSFSKWLENRDQLKDSLGIKALLLSHRKKITIKEAAEKVGMTHYQGLWTLARSHGGAVEHNVCIEPPKVDV